MPPPIDNNELWARMDAQNAALQSKWDEYYRMQQEQFNTLQDKQEVARTVETVYNEVSKGTGDALFFMEQWEKVVDKQAENKHAVALGLDAPHSRAEMNNEMFSGNQTEDWSWLHTENPYNQSPQDAANHAADVAQWELEHPGTPPPPGL